MEDKNSYDPADTIRTDYIRTDLASECNFTKENGNESGVIFSENTYGDVSVSSLHILNANGERATGKPCGSYVTVNFGKIWLCDDTDFDRIAGIIANELRRLAGSIACGNGSVLVAGLGNQYITPDSLGPLSVKNITVTRHIRQYDPGLYKRMGYREISAVTPGVVGQTGIETLELIRGAVDNVKPQLLVIIDALAARSVDRLATTVQITDNGIAPGSGIGNKRRAINSGEIGIPVIVIGAPTVVDSSTLVYDALDKAGIKEITPELTRVLENGRSFFVSLKESDVAIAELARLVAKSLDLAFSQEE